MENYRAHIPHNSDMFRSCLPRARGWASTRREGDLGGVERRTPLRASMTPFVLRLFALVSAAMSAPVSARPGNSFLPGPANGYGFLVPSPAGGLGCGSLNYVNCFPGVADTLRRWTSQLRSVYASPATYLPHTRATFQTPLDARAEVEAEGLHPSLADAHVAFLLDVRGDVYAETTAAFLPDAVALLDAFESMGQHARDARDAFVEAALPSAELVAAAETRKALEVVEGASRNKATPSTTHKILVDPPNADE